VFLFLISSIRIFEYSNPAVVLTVLNILINDITISHHDESFRIIHDRD